MAILLIPAVPALTGLAAGIASTLGAHGASIALCTITAKTSALAAAHFATTILRDACESDRNEFLEKCKDGVDGDFCAMKKASYMASCGGQIVGRIATGSIVLDMIPFPSMSSLQFWKK